MKQTKYCIDTKACPSLCFQAIEDAETNANEEAADEDSKANLRVDDPRLTEAIKKAAEEVAHKADLLVRRSKIRRDRKRNPAPGSTREVRQGARAGAERVGSPGGRDADADPTEPANAAPGSSLLRAALLCRPVSLREPGTAGRLNFSLQGAAAGESETQPAVAVADGSPQGGSEEKAPDPGVAAKPKARRPKLAPKPVGAGKSEPRSPAVAQEVGAAKAGVKRNGEAKPRRAREKPYQCGVCSRWFGCKSHVVEHMRTHTGEFLV